MSFAPGTYISDELEARGWTVVDLRIKSNLSDLTVRDIIIGEQSITLEIANALAEAFGTSAKLWLNLQRAYDKAKLNPKQ